MKKLIVISFLALTACSNSINGETVSLLDYTTQNELSSIGYTPDKISETNTIMKNEFGYSRYNGYIRYKFNNFDVITNPNDPNELYIVQDGDFLFNTKQPDIIKLYKKGTTFPNRSDTAIYFDRSQPLLIVADEDQLYYDLDLDGSDVTYEKNIFTGTEKYMNYVDLLPLPHHEKALAANIPTQQCMKTAGSFACCLTDDGTYQPYSFDLKVGWEKFNGKKAFQLCNPDN